MLSSTKNKMAAAMLKGTWPIWKRLLDPARSEGRRSSASQASDQGAWLFQRAGDFQCNFAGQGYVESGLIADMSRTLT